MHEAAREVALEGTVERVTFYNPQNGFSVLKVRVRGRREPVAVVGTLPAVQPGETLALRGQWRIDPQHGTQFQPCQAEIGRPRETADIVRYLGSGLIRQIGPVLAERIVTTFGERTLEVLDTTPAQVAVVPGIGRRRAQAISAAWAEHRALRGIVAFLSAHHIDTRYAPRLLASFGAAAPKILAANPYRLVSDVRGLGFEVADRLGQAVGVRASSPARLQAVVLATLLWAREQGHTRMQWPDLVATAAARATAAPELIEAAITQQLARSVIATSGAPPAAPAAARPALVSPAETALALFGPSETPAPPQPRPVPRPAETTTSSVRIYVPTPPPPVAAGGPGLGLTALVQAEEELAARLLALAVRPGLEAARVAQWLATDPSVQALSPEQRQAVQAAATCGCFVLTGGPGVGKTTTVRALVRCLQALGRTVALAAPTGKAAQRLGTVVGLEAQTIHRLLGAGPTGFRHGPHEPLAAETVIVDECSMLDTQLARAVVRAVGPQAQLVLVGDADQLPSVGPGQVLRDLLASGRVPALTLSTVFRQAARSQIVVNAHRIRHGEPPVFAPARALPTGADCLFIAAPAPGVAEVGARWAAQELPQALGVAPAEVQALAPLTRVCQTLNHALQAQLNPARGQPERPHGALPLRVGDRVIQTRNNYRLGVFNGEIGLLHAIAPDTVSVDFEGRMVSYAPADLLDLDHAYCLTVHRAQGSEWPGVIVLASSTYGPMLTRNLLYTALTRARRAVVVVGDEAAIATAVATTRDTQRQTGLPWLLGTETGHGVA